MRAFATMAAFAAILILTPRVSPIVSDGPLPLPPSPDGKFVSDGPLPLPPSPDGK